jgi:hypothetical protein
MIALESDTIVKTVGEDFPDSSSDDENDFYDADETVE